MAAFADAGAIPSFTRLVRDLLLVGRLATELTPALQLANRAGCDPFPSTDAQLVATHRKFQPRGFETIAVSMRHDPPALVAHFAETRRLPFAVAIDHTGEIARRFGDVRLTPTTVLVDQQGRIVERYVGEPDFAALQVRVERLLAAG